MSWKDNENPDQPALPPAAGEEEDELFVFGYGCKIFRDDEKAVWVDEGHHLIPWMGDTDSGLSIDRYDARGALMDLKRYEAPPGGANYLEGLTPEELRIEKLCEEERYRDLGDEEEDEDMKLFYEETGGRFGNGGHSTNKEFGSVAYVYNDAPATIGPEPKKLHDEIPFAAPANLVIPPDILLPTTMKLHAIIEKTAKFIASQGTQMEIILKTKQAKNPLFDFLAHSDPLNPYYKFLVDAIKTNVYKPPDEIPYPDDSSPSERDGSENSSDDEGGYLHPSLMKPSSDITKFIPQGSFKPSLNCAYSMLVSKIKEFTSESNPPATEVTPASECPVQEQALPGYPPQQVQVMPSPQDQLIIEKMANYVVKNGPDFEVVARTKGDPRFAFLDTYHPHHWYYLQCKEKCTIEAQAVVASKGFVSYNEINSTTVTPVATGQQTQSQQIQPPVASYPVSSSSGIPATTVPFKNTASVEEPRRSAVIKVRKEPPKPKSDKVIKLPLSLPNFTSVLRQQSAEDDGENIKKDLQEVKDEKGEEEEAKKKEERRKKAALFLQRLKKLEPLQAQTNVTTVVDLTSSDVESLPSPSSLARDESRIPEIRDGVPKNSKDSSSERFREKSIDRTRYESSSSRKYDRSRSGTKEPDRDHRSRSRRRSRSSSHRHRRSRTSDLSDRSHSRSSSSSSSGSSSSFSSRRKKSKRKHSRKRHKKRDRSKSKKSKKHRR